MSNKTTLLLAVCTGIIFLVIGIGFISSSPQTEPKSQTQTKTAATEETLPSAAELRQQLTTETPTITTAITNALPTLEQNYTIERAKLYHKGEWYGAILQYKGSDTNNRDTLRIVLQKKDGSWILRTKTPGILVNRLDIPDAPQSMLNDINQPATLQGTETSPTITPGE